MEPERAELELAGAEADPEPEPEKRNGGRWRRTLMASRLLFSPDSFYQIVAQLFSLFFAFHVLRRAPRVLSSNSTSSPTLRPRISWVISWGASSRGTKIAWRCRTCETTPMIPRRSMIDPDDYDIGPPAQSKFGSQLVPHPPNSNLSSDLTSARTQMTAQISTQNPGHIHQIHISPDPHMNSRFILICEHNLSRLWVPPRTTHTRACELGGSGDSH